MIENKDIEKYANEAKERQLKSFDRIARLLASMDKAIFEQLSKYLREKTKGNQGFTIKDGRIQNTPANRIAMDNLMTNYERLIRQLVWKSSKELGNTLVDVMDEVVIEIRRATDHTKAFNGTMVDDRSKLDKAAQRAYLGALERTGFYIDIPESRQNRYYKASKGIYLRKDSPIGKRFNPAGIVDELGDLINDAIRNQRPYLSAFNNIEKLFTGRTHLLGKNFKGYLFSTIQIARRAESKIMANELDFEFAKYVGGRRNNRPICGGGYDKLAKKRLPSLINKIFHRSEIPGLFSYKNWQGKFSWQRPEDAEEACGGANCNHDFVFTGTLFALSKEPSKRKLVGTPF